MKGSRAAISYACAVGLLAGLLSPVSSRAEIHGFSNTQIRLNVLGYLQIAFGACEPSKEDLLFFNGMDSDLDSQFFSAVRPSGTLARQGAEARAPKAESDPRKSPSPFFLWLRESLRLDLRKIYIERVEEPVKAGDTWVIIVRTSRPAHHLVLRHVQSDTVIETGWIWIDRIDGKPVEDLLDAGEVRSFMRKHEKDLERAPSCH
jgi:hypothetical protein